MTSMQSSLLRGGNGPTMPSPKRAKLDDAQLPEAYQQQRPPWRPPLHPAAVGGDLPDLFPTKPYQPENDMSQVSVRKGFAAHPYVRNESFSAHEMIYTRLASPDTIHLLSSCMDEILQRRRELDRNNVAPSQYRPPSRVTLNEAKLANYVKDLADPSVPLTRLSRSVPHGFRGEKLFEMLWAGGALPSATAAGANANYFNPRNAPSTQQFQALSCSAASISAPTAPRKSVDISRAVWFIRALGAAELSSLRNKSAATIVPEITSNLCTWMAKQVAELNLIQAAESSSTAAAAAAAAAASPAPLSPSPHLSRTFGAGPSSLSRSMAAAHFAAPTPPHPNPASSPSPAPAKQVCTVLQNPVDQERWTAKWSYSLSLARHLHAQHLLDPSLLVRWIVDAFAASNLVQLPFLVELVQEVLLLILRRRCFVKPFLTALLVQIPSLDARLDRAAAGGLRNKLMLLLRIVCETCPDLLISPRLWFEHAGTLAQLLNQLNAETEADAVGTTVATQLSDYVERTVKPRVERLLLQSQRRSTDDAHHTTSTPSPASPTLQQHMDIHALDSFDMKTVDRVFLQNGPPGKSPAKYTRDDAFWAPRVETILTWACTDRRIGVARQYLAATLIEKIRFGVSWQETSEGSDQLSLPAFDFEHHAKKTRKINVEPMLIKWLGDVEATLNMGTDNSPSELRAGLLATIELSSIVVLTGELARRGVFSYTKYLQRLIARGMTTAPSSSKEDDNEAAALASAPPPALGSAASRDSLHLRLLRSLPLYDQPASVYQQRRQAIYGDRTKETYEDAAQRRALRQLQSFLPFAFAETPDSGIEIPAIATMCTSAAPPSSGDIDDTNPNEALSRLWSASRYVRCKIFRTDLVPAVSARIDYLNGEQLSRIAAVLVMGDDFESLAQLLATLLLRPLSDSLARATFNLVIEHSLVWRSMDIMGTLNQLVRQQLNHSSSIRNDRQAVMASTTLLRLRTLIEGIPSRMHAPVPELASERDAIQQHVRALRPNVDVLLDRFAQKLQQQHASSEVGQNSAATPAAEGSDILTPFRSLFLQPDATSDEIIEGTIVEGVLERPNETLIPAAVRLIDQLYLEASLEIDERHARWLAHLANSMQQHMHAESSVKALLGLLTRLIAHGTLNLQLAMDTFLLPYLLSLVRRMTDPATRNAESAFHLVAVVGSLGQMFASSLDDVSNPTLSYEDARAFGAQAKLLFAQVNLPLLLRTASCLICASDEWSPMEASDKAQIESFWKSLLRSEPMQIAFRQDARTCMLTIRDTCKSMWGCNPSRVMDIAMACLHSNSLLLRDVGSIDAASVRARLDGWDTAVVANELVEIFERLQLVESSFQSRADSKTRALASGIFDDLFVRLPDIGAQLMRDCQSSGLISRFTDIGIKILSDKVKAGADAVRTWSKAMADDAGVEAKADVQDATPTQNTVSKGSSGEGIVAADERLPESQVEFTMRSVLHMCEQQDSFIFNATDADSCGQLLVHVIASLEAAVASSTKIGSTGDDGLATRLSALLDSRLTLQLLHLVMRFGCLWNGSMKATALRLVKALLELTRQAGARAECGRQFVLLLDSVSFVLDELPPQLLSACIPDLETQLQQVDLATSERTEKLQHLSFMLDNPARPAGWFVASSARAAVKRGWFTPAGLNPWDCAEYLDINAAGAHTTQTGKALGQMQARNLSNPTATAMVGDAFSQTNPVLPSARSGWPDKLTLNTAIPLCMLGVGVTRDLVPHHASRLAASPTGLSDSCTTPCLAASTEEERCRRLPISVESERSYGSRIAGEPIFSRHLRRGLLPHPTLPSLHKGKAPTTNANVAHGVPLKRGEEPRARMSEEAIPVIDLTYDDLAGAEHFQPSAARRSGRGASWKRSMSQRD
ncbi:putative Mediator of RNA polymerase II transcription subunit 12 [Ustilago hordei]|uniref:Mediator of RNA polymerase II transcription subunit 12 n=1 Tax=Ustilago hordei TaxID=120017 RepID=I2FRL5_USTHO|nr:putative Mediator of RNA polymerase II transcription subunit 12 [Ustilago hordei]CCF49558.1 uncharacterized protein UHOR_03037 [Ustilago hordei]SYW87142.1 probable Mediator of RNA polymerase II transcription subunit 12 [Ustilago hordei]